jgi:hypothetical protein
MLCVGLKHNKHNFEPVEKILPKKLDDLKGAEARYSKDLTLCQAKVNEFKISEVKYEIMDFFTFITQNCITLNAPPF